MSNKDPQSRKGWLQPTAATIAATLGVILIGNHIYDSNNNVVDIGYEDYQPDYEPTSSLDLGRVAVSPQLIVPESSRDDLPEPVPAENTQDTKQEEQADANNEAQEIDNSGLNIESSPIVGLTIDKIDINTTVVSYDIPWKQIEETGHIEYNPNGMMTVNAINEELLVNTDDDPEPEQVFGPIGIEDGKPTNLVKIFGHNNSTGPGAFNRLQELAPGDKVVATSEIGADFIYEVVGYKDEAKSDIRSLDETVGPDGGVIFSCRTIVNDEGVQRTDEYRAFALKLIGVKKPGDDKSILIN